MARKSSRSLVLCVALLLPSAAAWCEAPSDKSLDALLTVTKMQSTLEGIYGNLDQLMRQSLEKALQGQSLSDKQRQAIDAGTRRYMAVVRDEMGWDKMRPMYMQIYRESFSEDEIDQLTAFYRTPTGQIMIDKMPLVMQKSMTAIQSRMGPMIERMQAAMKETMDEIQKAK